MKIEQIAINSVSTRHKDLEEALAAYAAAGFKNIEFCLPHVKSWMTDGRGVPEVLTLLEKHGQKSVGGFETHFVAFGSLEDKNKNHALLISNAKLLSDLGGGTMIVGSDGDDKNNIDTLKTIGKGLRDLANQIPANVKLGVEFNWSPVIKSLRSADIVVTEADHAQVGILFDPAHYHCTPTKFDDITPDVVKKIVHVHVNDMANKPGDRSNCNADRVLPGDGIVGVKKVFKQFEKFGYTGLFSIEMFSDELWGKPAVEASKIMYKSMKKLVSR